MKKELYLSRSPSAVQSRRTVCCAVAGNCLFAMYACFSVGQHMRFTGDINRINSIEYSSTNWWFGQKN